MVQRLTSTAITAPPPAEPVKPLRETRETPTRNGGAPIDAREEERRQLPLRTVEPSPFAPQPQAPEAPSAPTSGFLAPPDYFDVRIQAEADESDTVPVDAELYDQWPEDWRKSYRQLVTDPAIQALAQRASHAIGDRPVEVVFIFDTRNSHFDGNAIYLQLVPDPSQALSPKDMRQSAVHELAHLWQRALYDGWLPRHNYSGSNPLERQLKGHWLDKATTRSTAWLEGFPEALVAFYAGDFRLDTFATRGRICMERRGPKPPKELERTEGYVASILLDFWSPRGDDRRLARTADVLSIQDRQSLGTERHDSLSAYLREHLERYPDDLVRWHLVIQAASMLQGGVGKHDVITGEQRTALTSLDHVLARLAERYGTTRVAAALQRLVVRSPEVPETATALEAAVRGELEKVQAPVFRNALLAARPYETMPLAELKQAIADAERDYGRAKQIIGYSTHPQLEELDELRRTLRAVYARRGGR